MSRALPLCIVVLLAACKDLGALELVVSSTQNVTRVRLYFGVGPNDTTPIGPQGFTYGLAPTRSWALDPHASRDIRDLEVGEDAVFQLTRGDSGEDKLALAIFVGFDAGGAPIAVAKLDHIDIPAASIARYFVALVPLSQQDRQVITWPHGEDTCVAYSEQLQRPGAGVDMVVTAGDPDCDSYIENECDPNVFKASEAADLADVSCLADQPVLAGSGATPALEVGCTLGGPACVDGNPDPSPSGCAVTPYCVPESVCAQCAQDGVSCARDVMTAFTDVGNLPTFIQCVTGRDPDANTICDDVMRVKLGLPLAGAKCQGEIAVAGPNGAFGPAAMFVTPQGNVDVVVGSLDENCDFDVKVAGDVPNAGMNLFVATGIVAGMLDSGRGFAIPLLVESEYGQACGTNNECSLVTRGYDLLDECLNTPIDPSSE